MGKLKTYFNECVAADDKAKWDKLTDRVDDFATKLANPTPQKAALIEAETKPKTVDAKKESKSKSKNEEKKSEPKKKKEKAADKLKNTILEAIKEPVKDDSSEVEALKKQISSRLHILKDNFEAQFSADSDLQ